MIIVEKPKTITMVQLDNDKGSRISRKYVMDIQEHKSPTCSTNVSV